jgi:hypothetical protein
MLERQKSIQSTRESPKGGVVQARPINSLSTPSDPREQNNAAALYSSLVLSFFFFLVLPILSS